MEEDTNCDYGIDIDKVCRLCLCICNNAVGYQDTLLVIGEQCMASFVSSLAEDLKLDPIDKIPGIVCNKCIELAAETYEFIQQCRQSKLTFLHWISSVYDELITGETHENETFNTDEHDYLTLSHLPMHVENGIDNHSVPGNATSPTIDPASFPTESTEETSQAIIEPILVSCTICGKNVKSTSLSNHIKVMHKSKMKACPDCGKLYKKKNFIRHRRTHRPSDERFECSKCDNKFASFDLLKVHKSDAHKSDDVPSPLSSCSLCGIKMKKGSLRRHMTIFHEKKFIPCSYCGKSIVSSYWSRHLAKHERQKKLFLCHICGEVRKSQGLLDRHGRKHKNESANLPPKFQCEFCDASFRGSDSLKRHVLLHLGEKEFMCGVCDKTFYTLIEKVRHSKQVHEKLKPFTCVYCPKKFVSNSLLRHHVMVHKNYRPHYCKHCTQKFVSRLNLKQHLVVKHGVTEPVEKLERMDPKYYVPMETLLKM